jgi:hypothetical protein
MNLSARTLSQVHFIKKVANPPNIGAVMTTVPRFLHMFSGWFNVIIIIMELKNVIKNRQNPA